MTPEADKELAAEHGVSAQTILELRKSSLQEGLHYVFLSSGALSYTDEGEELLRTLLVPASEKKEKGPPPPSAPPTGTAPEPPEEEEVTKLTVTRLYPNPIFVQCLVPGGKQRVDVRINPHAGLAVGSTIECVKDGDEWICVQPGIKPRR